jgi:voltage-gated potassium channel
MYFAFTSLSTVGFGDYYPVSDIERLTSSVLLLFGVAMFSYILTDLLSQIELINQQNALPGSEESLEKFFATL